MLFVGLVSLVLVGSVTSAPTTGTTDPEWVPTTGPDVTTTTTSDNICDEVLFGSGPLHENYGQDVAHRLHSMTVEDIKYYFGVSVTLDNGIPTVNTNLSTNARRVLSDAPVAGYDGDFLTQAMKQLDKVLSNMDDPDWAIVNYSLVEKIAHSFHMSELWARSKSHYDILATNPLSEEVCGCLTSSESDVLPALELLALKIKFPGLTSGHETPPAAPPAERKAGGKAYVLYIETGKKGEKGSPRVVRDTEQVAPDTFDAHDAGSQMPEENGYKLSIGIDFNKQYKRHLRNFDFSGTDEDVIRKVQEELVDGDAGLDDRLESEEGWNTWRQGFKDMDDFGNYQFAAYMHCKLR